MAGAPEHIKKFKELKKKAKQIADTTDLAHSEAYNIATMVLKNKEGNIDYDLLEKEDIQQKFLDKMVGHYVERANKYFGSKINPKDRIQVDQLMKAYAGVTRTKLEEDMRVQGKDYTQKYHEGLRDELMKAVKEQLSSSARSHLKDKHVKDILKELPDIGKIVDEDKVRLQDAMILYDIYDQGGAISKKGIETAYKHMGASPPFLKKYKK